MPRVKRGVTKHHRHKKVLSYTKGHRATSHSLYKRGHESMIKALSYAFRHRLERKRDMRRLWIQRVNAAARQLGIKYSELISGLKKAKVEVNRKMLADLAVQDPQAFSRLVEMAKGATASE